MFIALGLWITTAIISENAVFSNNSLSKITNRKLKLILNIACKSQKNFSYVDKNNLYNRLKGQDVSSHMLATEILSISHNGLDMDFVLNLIFEQFKGCPVCHRGIMKKIDLTDVHSYDYNKDGFLPPYCDNCGNGYREYLIVTR